MYLPDIAQIFKTMYWYSYIIKNRNLGHIFEMRKNYRALDEEIGPSIQVKSYNARLERKLSFRPMIIHPFVPKALVNGTKSPAGPAKNTTFTSLQIVETVAELNY